MKLYIKKVLKKVSKVINTNSGEQMEYFLTKNVRKMGIMMESTNIK